MQQIRPRPGLLRPWTIQQAFLQHNRSMCMASCVQHDSQQHRQEARIPCRRAGGVRLALIGDVHGRRNWDACIDIPALRHVAPDCVLLVGDIGEEAIELVQYIQESLTTAGLPFAIQLGNHDAWWSLTAKRLGSGPHEDPYDGVKRQLELLGASHLAYTTKQLSQHKLSIVGGRAFSKGGKWNTVAGFYKEVYGLHSQQESADRLAQELLAQPQDHAAVVIAHSGPTGLGSERWSPCGNDFYLGKPRPSEADWGDRDLELALQQAGSYGRQPALVTFGHMHHSLNHRNGGGLRDRTAISQDGMVYINCAVVPRHREGEDGRLQTHCCIVDLAAGHVLAAADCWIAVDGQQNCTPAAVQELVRTISGAESGSEVLVREHFLAHGASEWQLAVTRLPQSFGAVGH